LVVSLLIATDTTEELELTTSCNSEITYFLNKETLDGSLFLWYTSKVLCKHKHERQCKL